MLNFNTKTIHEIHFTKSEDGTFKGYIISDVVDKTTQKNIKAKFDIPRLDASKGLNNLELLPSNDSEMSVQE